MESHQESSYYSQSGFPWSVWLSAVALGLVVVATLIWGMEPV